MHLEIVGLKMQVDASPFSRSGVCLQGGCECLPWLEVKGEGILSGKVRREANVLNCI